MPEIKHNFTGGKMNKDLNERLVPKGEYRDAMNIQVSTSEGSDVGVVQNILGNSLISELGYLSSNSTCVGAVADEKNDALYWFVTDVPSDYYVVPGTGTNIDVNAFTSSSPQGAQVGYKDMILQLKSGIITPVFVARRAEAAYTIYQTGGNISWNSTAGTITFPPSLSVADLQVGMSLQGDSTTLQMSFTGMIVSDVDINTNTITINGDITWIDSSVTGQQGQHGTKLFFLSLSDSGQATILGFKTGSLITGIDIIDDMLFWTDGITEPKKINISRSIEGTPSGNFHTRLINPAQNISYGSGVLVQEEHITVIKNSPKNALHLELNDGRDPLLSYSGITTVGLNAATSSVLGSSNSTVVYDFTTLQIGDTVRFSIQTDYSFSTSMDFAWEEDNYLLLKEFDNNNNTASPVPLANWTIRGLITGWTGNNFNSTAGNVQVEIEVVGLKGTPLEPDPSNIYTPLNYVVDYEDTEPDIFEDKFPRFSYRYKYEDGEYSTYAPWSEVAFSPTVFDYDPKQGWNTGMLNNIKNVKVKGFQPTTSTTLTGRDVIEVDILYKEDTSPNVYLVQTISPIDILQSGQSLLPWYADEYLIKSEAIKNTLPSNQLLRPWDNVPKKALAQSVSGNRLVYANYDQNYDLFVNNELYKPEFKNSLVSWSPPSINIPKKSIKSLRDYKLGVVFTDKYGRETPVLIGESGGFKVEKTDSVNANRLKVGLKSSVPPGLPFYKFYIKETSSEYYNLAMDRWYKAEDGNIWLAFPSSDRNKVDLDTSFYFKRGEDSDDNVIENSTKYKVLAIENEAPEFIKTRRLRIGTIGHYANTAQVFGSPSSPLLGAPSVGGISFSMNYDGGGFGGTSLSNLEDIKEDLYIQFVSSGDYSEQYKVAEITSDRDLSSGGSGVPETYFVTLATNLKNNINFIFDNPTAPSLIKDDTKIAFTKAVIENKPQFDGRFFAKIENDGKIKSQITDNSIGVNYIETASKKVYVLDHDGLLKQSSSAAVVEGSSYGNLVTQDWSGFITGGNALQQAENPNGTNWNFLAARNAYFQKGNNIASTDNSNEPSNSWPFAQINSLFHPTFQSPWGISSSNHSMKFSVDQDKAGVWFIDRSTKKYRLNTTGLNDNVLDWPDTHAMNHVSPACTFATDCGAYVDEQGNVGGGISQNGTEINLGFGGFGGVNGWWIGNSGGNCAQNNWWFNNNPKNNYFGVGATNANWNDVATTAFVSSLEAGFKFKWREDPTETIYKIEGQTSYQKNLRFGRADDSICSTTTHLIGALSSYTKTFTFKVTPSMNGWNPAADPGTYMNNGLHLGNGVLYNPSHSSVSSGDSTITVSNISDLKVGMSVIHSEYASDTKIIAVNNFTSTVITSNTCGSGGASVNTIEFGFTIRIVEAHVYGITGNANDPRDNYIVVDNIITECSNGNSLKPTYSLHKGMMLDSYNLDSTVKNPSSAVVIESITPHTNGHKIKIAGYYAPMNYFSSAGNFGDDFVIGERLLFKQVSMNGASNFTEKNTADCQVNGPTVNGSPLGMIGAVGYDMVFVDAVDEYADGGTLPENPFVWETEPKENTALDIYYEISENLPTTLGPDTIEMAIPIGSDVVNNQGEGLPSWNNVSVLNNSNPSGKEIILNQYAWVGTGPGPGNIPPLMSGSLLSITKPNGVNFTVEIDEVILDSLPLTDISRTFKIKDSLHNSNYRLNWHNCYSFGNGVECNRIKDTFNSPFISNGVKASTTLIEDYKSESRKSGLIYSGIYNSTSGVNNLNQFIAAEKITKDINPIYGSIQKLHSGWGQGGDLIALCEDRVLKILANKDALFNADGNSNVTSTNNVLGQAIPYSGEYGISKNPESFASEAYRIYFTDKVRGTVMRLSMDGLTPISNHGMKDWFRDNLKLGDKLIGSYDDKKDEYNITIKSNTTAKTVTFKEGVKGWVSFKSFTPENAISCANEYYTFKNGNIWKHHDESVDRNTFYNQNLVPSSVEVIFNEVPGSVKSFKTINYEGSQAKITSKDENGITLMDGEYFNLTEEKGWHVTDVITNLEQGGITEFVKKEGKWFGYVIGNDITISSIGNISSDNYHTEDSSIQGIGKTASVTTSVVFGCMDDTMFNYNDAATNDDGSCEPFVYGCMDVSADNYLVSANTDDGTCYWLGCTTGPLALAAQELSGGSLNFDANATVDDGSCIPAVWGCTALGNWNYNPLADFGSGILSNGNFCGYANCMCIPFIGGCTDPNASNYITPVDEMIDVNYDDGSCEYLGCTDPLAENYDPIFVGSTVDGPNGNYAYLNGTAVDDGSCTYIGGCMDNLACNYDALATIDNGSCNYCGDTGANVVNFDYADSSCTAGCEYCYGPTNLQIISQTTADTGMSNGTVTIEWTESTSPSISYYDIMFGGSFATVVDSGTGTGTYTITGLPTGTINISINGYCDKVLGNYAIGLGPNTSVTITTTPIPGCTDSTGANNNVGGTWGACNYNNLATVDDGSCDYTICTGCNDNTYLEYCGDCWDAINQVVVASGGSAWVADTIPTSCLTPIVNGCMDATAFNYDPNATVDDGSCVPIILGCTDDTLNNNGTYAASNYTALANTDDGSCNSYECPIISIENVTAQTGVGGAAFAFRVKSNLTPYSFGPAEVTSEWSVGTLGFTGDVNVTGSTGSWVGTTNSVGANNWQNYLSSGFSQIGAKKLIQPDSKFFSPGDTTVTIEFNLYTNDGNCTLSTSNTYSIGCTDNSADNTGSFDITDDTQCEYSGCTNSNAPNYNPLATTDDGSCILPGCTDPLANNYDPTADPDDGSCTYTGCMDATLNPDGSGTYAADNYNPDATTPCTTGCVGNLTGDNCCCTYSGTPSVSMLAGNPPWGATAFMNIVSLGQNLDTAYDQATVTSIDLGVGTTTSTINNPAIEIASGGVWSYPSIGSQPFSGSVIQPDWAPYVDINNTYGVGSGDLTITYYVDWSGTIDNPSMNDVITTSTSDTLVVSAGCKTDGSAMNYDPNVTLHIDGSCVAPNPGCMDSTATNYNATFNQDCTFTGSANPTDCCCYACSDPLWDSTNPVVVNTWNSLTSPTHATQITFNFAAVNTAVSYSIVIQLGAASTIVGLNVVPTSINNGIASYVYNSPWPAGSTWFQDGTTYAFAVVANCENGDGGSCGQGSSGYISLELNSNI